MIRILAFLVFFSSLNFGPIWAQTPANGQPFVRLDKSVFASGEAVFFWVGVEAIRDTSIPKEYWNTCRLVITRPDGTEKVVKTSWPIDGMGTNGPGSNGWMGGCGLGEPAKPGRYVLAFEFAGQKSKPTELIVKEIPLLKQIQAEFVFGKSAKSGESLDTPVTLTVRNNTDQTLRFPHRDGVNGFVSVSLSKVSGGYYNGDFYPAKGLLDQDELEAPNRSFDEFSWKLAKELPTITLKPGETYSQKLSLRAVVTDKNKTAASGGGLSVPAGSYNVTFSTTLQMLIGEEGGDYAAVSPVHIPVSSTKTCDIAR